MSGEWDGLRAAAEAATAGPWGFGGAGVGTAYFDGRREQFVAVTDQSAVTGAEWSLASLRTDRANGEFIAAASPDVVLGLLDRLQAAEEEVALLHKVRDMEWDADAPMPESNTPDWGTEDYRRHAVLFNDIAHAPLNARLGFSDRLRMQRTLWALGWRRDVRPEDVTENRPQEATGADLSASGAESDGGRGDGEGLG